MVILLYFSDELRKALGLKSQDLPDYIYRMRLLGYPPGYLLEAEVTSSGLAVYDKLRGKKCNASSFLKREVVMVLNHCNIENRLVGNQF